MAESRRVSSNSSAHERAQLAAVAQELLQGARQAAVAVREVLAQDLVQGGRGALVGRLRLRTQRLELAPHDVHVQRHPGVLERGQADAQRALQRGPVGPPRARSATNAAERGVHEREALDDQPVAIDADGRRGPRPGRGAGRVGRVPCRDPRAGCAS